MGDFGCSNFPSMAPFPERPLPATLRLAVVFDFELFMDFDAREELRLRPALFDLAVGGFLFGIIRPYFLRPPFLPPLRDEL